MSEQPYPAPRILTQPVARFPTLTHVYIAAAITLLGLRPLLTPIMPHDFWWHIATGRLIWQQGAIPLVDSFSFTRVGEPFYNQGWLAQLLMYGLHQLGGVPLLLLVQALVIVLAYGLLLRIMTERTARPRLCVALLLLTAMPLSFDNWTIRPQSYSFPLFVGFLYVLHRWRTGGSNRLWLLPVLMALWANIHGSFVLGFVLIALFWLGALLERWGARQHAPTDPIDASLPAALPLRQLVFVGVACLAAALLNPRGVALFGYVQNLLGTSAVTRLVTEWAPPTVREPAGAIFFLFVIGLVTLLAYAPRRAPVTDLLLVGAFFWLALGAGRNIVWFGFVATLLLAVLAASCFAKPARQTPGQRGPNIALLGLLGVLLIIGLPWVKPALVPPPLGNLLAPEHPVAATSALQALPDRPRRLFHPMGAGSYLIWAAPEQPVFIDPRIELYPYEQWLDYINLSQGQNVIALLERYTIDGALLDIQEQAGLLAVLRADPSWQERYQDDRFVLLTRR